MTGLYTGLAAAAISALGAGTSMAVTQGNLKKQDSQAAANIIKQGQINSKATNKVNELNANIAKSDPNAAEKQQTAAYLKALQQADPAQSGVNPAVKGASKRYDAATGAAKADVGNYARSTAQAMAATAAPQLQRIGEGNRIAGTASDLGLLNDQSNMQNGIFKTQLAGDTNDPYLSSLSGLLQGAGSGLSTYAGTKSKGSNPYLAGG
jgi:hypothetical protein